MTIDLSKTTPAEAIGYLQAAVAPRPIALVSTIDQKGQVNLSPFSFYNVFSSNPPVLIFSPSRRVRDNTTKHTLENVLEMPECVIHAVSYDMVQQTSLSSTEYEKGVNEFEKAGFSMLPSEKVKAPRAAEALVAMECKVLEVKSLGDEGGAGNLVICEVLMIHVNDKVLHPDGKIDTKKLDLVARMGENWYARANEPALFEIPKPLSTKGIGIDALPEGVRNSKVLTGNHLAMLGNVETLPAAKLSADEEVHRKVADLLDDKKLDEAYALLVQK